MFLEGFVQHPPAFFVDCEFGIQFHVVCGEQILVGESLPQIDTDAFIEEVLIILYGSFVLFLFMSGFQRFNLSREFLLFAFFLLHQGGMSLLAIFLFSFGYHPKQDKKRHYGHAR